MGKARQRVRSSVPSAQCPDQEWRQAGKGPQRNGTPEKISPAVFNIAVPCLAALVFVNSIWGVRYVYRTRSVL